MVEGDERKGAEAPKDEGVREARNRSLTNHLCLAEDFPKEVPRTAPNGKEAKVSVFFGANDSLEDGAKSPPEKHGGNDGQNGKEELFPEGKVLRLSQGCGQQEHSRTFHTIHDLRQGWRGRECRLARRHNLGLLDIRQAGRG